jgi:hypothetical protein
MFSMDLEGVACGIIARTIGGPYAVLIAEQLQAAGAKLIVGLTSAGRVSPDLPLPCLVVATSAIRDEGTSYHYLPPDSEVACKSPVVPLLERELIATGWAVRSGKVWTTDAPYRETKAQLTKWSREGVLAVEMQAASLFAFGVARHTSVASVATMVCESSRASHERPGLFLPPRDLFDLTQVPTEAPEVNQLAAESHSGDVNKRRTNSSQVTPGPSPRLARSAAGRRLRVVSSKRSFSRRVHCSSAILERSPTRSSPEFSP